MRFALLISLLLISIPHGYANSTSFELSGYAYATIFQDTDWYDNTARAAVNFDITKNKIGLRGQVDTQEKQPRRLVIEYSYPSTEDTFLKVQVGRFVRFDGFYNNVTDSPSSSGMSILSLSTYNRTMVTGTFTLSDGSQVFATTKFIDTLVEYGFRAGKAFIESDSDLQKEAFGVVSDNLATKRRFNNFDLYSRVSSINGSEFLISYNHYSIDIVNHDPTDLLAAYIAGNATEINYDTIKVGMLRDFDRFKLSGEYSYGKTTTYSNLGQQTSRKDAHNAYLRFAYDVSDNVEAYSLYNYGMLESTDSISYDSSVGLLFNHGSWAFDIEWHTGKSKYGSWVKYESQDDKKSWNSFVTSVSLRF